MDHRGAPANLTAEQRRFAHFWQLTGAPELVGCQVVLVAMLARTDLQMFGRLTAVDLNDSDAVLAAIEAVHSWRRDVATGTGTFTFGPRPLRRITVDELNTITLPRTA